MKIPTRVVLVALAVLSVFCGGNAWSYSSIVAFGDSLSDNGNVRRFTDGALWVELLADHDSAALHDVAYGGATTGYDNPLIDSTQTGLLWQVENSLPLLTSQPPGATLLTIWAGANDLAQGRDSTQALVNIGAALDDLYEAGGRNFLVGNLPEVGRTPAYLSMDDPTAVAGATLWVDAFNSGLEDLLQEESATHPDMNLAEMDIAALFAQYAVGSPQWQALFWTDGFHPSAAGHEAIYRTALDSLGSSPQPVPIPRAVPEPATLLLLASSLLVLVGEMGLQRRQGR